MHFIYLTDGGQLDITAQLLYILWKIYSIYVSVKLLQFLTRFEYSLRSTRFIPRDKLQQYRKLHKLVKFARRKINKDTLNNYHRQKQ